MSDGKVEVVFTGDEMKLFRQIERLEAKNKDLEAELKRVKAGFQDAGDTGEKAMARIQKATDATARSEWEVDRAIRQTKKGWEDQAHSAEQVSKSLSPMAITGYVTAFVGGFSLIQKAIAQVNDELRLKVQLQAQAMEANLTVEVARAQIIRNMPGTSEAQKREVLRASATIAGEAKVPEQYVAAALAQALSASGVNIPGSIEAVKGSAKFLGTEPAQIAPFAGSLLDLAKITGTPDAMTNLGLLSFVGGLSRVVDPKMQAANVPTALIGMKSMGATPQESAALYGAMSMAAADVEGATTKTATIQLAKQLKEFLPETGLPEEVKSGLSEGDVLAREANRKALERAQARQEAGTRLTDKDISAIREEEGYAKKERERKVIPARPALKTMGERIAFLQNNPELAKLFVGDLSLRANEIGPAIELLTDRNSVVAREYTKNLGMLPNMAGLAQEGRGLIESLKLDPASMVGRAKRAYASAEEEMLINNLAGSLGGVNREGLVKVLKASGESDLATKLEKMKFEVGSGLGTTGGIDSAIQTIESRRQALLSPVSETAVGGYGYGGSIRTPRTPTGEETKAAESLLRVIDVLREIKGELAQSREEAKHHGTPPTLVPANKDK